jgi:hypothetical protein
MKRISEVITTKEIRTWKKTDIITITAGTGAGLLCRFATT